MLNLWGVEMLARTHEECLLHLEKVRWNGVPHCPYCGSTKATAYKSEQRYRCNSCFTSYSVTVGTLFHRTHVQLNIWFKAIHVVLQSPKHVSIRQLARQLDTNKNTAAAMLNRIQKAIAEDPDFLRRLIEVDYLE